MRKHFILIVLVVIIALALAGCKSEEKTEAAPVTPVNVQLAWIHEYWSAGFYAAVKNGHYTKENLQVTLTEGGFTDTGSINPIEVVVSGTHQFGLTSAEALLRARAEGQPVVAIATIMQRNPTGIISLAENGLNTPKDLSSHTILVTDGVAHGMVDALLKTQGIDPTTVTIAPRTTFGIDPLLNGETDALVGWIINEGVQVQEAGQTPTFILMSDYGIETYNSVIFTTESMIQEHPELVEKFLRATLDGYQDAIANPTQAIEYVLEYNSDLKQDEQLRRLEAMIPLINIPGQPIGMMDAPVWDYTHQILLETGGLKAPVDVQAAYTLQFLNAVYSK